MSLNFWRVSSLCVLITSSNSLEITDTTRELVCDRGIPRRALFHRALGQIPAVFPSVMDSKWSQQTRKVTQTPFPNYLFITNALKSLIRDSHGYAFPIESALPPRGDARALILRPELMLADIVGIGIFRRACYIALGYAD